MTMTPPSPAGAAVATGRVVSVADGQGQNAQGTWTKGKNVTYQLTSGQTGTVFIPADVFSVESVTAAVKAEAQKLADVANLTF
jgi:hypothetical protein